MVYRGCAEHTGTCTDCACAVVTHIDTIGGGTDVFGMVHEVEQHECTGMDTGTGIEMGTETGSGALVNVGKFPPVDAFPGGTVFCPTALTRCDLRDLVLHFELVNVALEDDLEGDLTLPSFWPDRRYF